MPSGIKKVFATPLNEVSTIVKEELGTLRFEGNKVYKYVKIQNATATVAFVAGDMACYRADKYDENQVVTDFTDADTIGIPAGALQGAGAGVLATAYYGWVQVRGFATLNQALAGSPSVGDELTALAATADKTATARLYSGTSPNIKANGGLLGRVMHVANKEVILECPY